MNKMMHSKMSLQLVCASYYAEAAGIMSVCSNFHLLPSHQEEVDGGNVYTDVVTEILQDIPDGGTRPQHDGGARTIWEHHAALSWRAFPHTDRVAIIRL